MTKLPDHLASKDFPLSVSSKGVATNTWDVSKQVLANLSALGIEHLIAIGGTTRSATRPSSTSSA
jgi:ATP-dependent phosphofructokinase / diphosphate-dependent phosphofructokinase